MISQCSESVSSPGVGGAVCSKNSSSSWRVYTYVSSAAHVNVRLERWPNAEKYAQKVINQVLAFSMRHEGDIHLALQAVVPMRSQPRKSRSLKKSVDSN